MAFYACGRHRNHVLRKKRRLLETYPAIHEPPTFISECERDSIFTLSNLTFHYLANMHIRHPTPLVVKSKNLMGRTIIITGADIGIGLETAVYFSHMFPGRMILAARDAERGKQAKGWVEEYSGRGVGRTKPEELDVWELDLNSFESVKHFAKRCLSELDRLDVLVLNAAVATREFSTTSDGYETS
jgi:hypothetical protein